MMIADLSDDLSLDELCRAVADELRGRGLIDHQPDSRVAALPDARTVRYYTTLGLVDRPRIVDREGRYGARHVRQIVAVKALQHAGHTLAQAQERLYGRSDAELGALLDAATLAASSVERPGATTAPKAVQLRELTIEPGLRLVVEQGYRPQLDPEALARRIRAALDALAQQDSNTADKHGGS